MDNKSNEKLSFIINIGYFAVVILLVYLAFKYAVPALMPFIIAFILITLINPLVKRLNNRFPTRRGAISFILVALLYILFGGLLFGIIFKIIIEVWDLANTVAVEYYPTVIKPGMQELLNWFSELVDTLPPEWQDSVSSAQSSVMTSVQDFVLGLAPRVMSFASSFTSKVPSFIVALVFTIMLTFFVGRRYDDVVGFIKVQLPERAVTVIRELKVLVSETVVKYLSAVLKLMGITAVELFIGFLIIGIDHAIVIAIGIAILDALPVFGTGAAMIPWVIIKVIQGDYTTAISLGILYAAVTVIRNIIEPKIVGGSLGLNPIVTVIAMYFGFKTFGVFGMIFMPIIAQIIIELNNRGAIHIFKPYTPEPLPESGVKRLKKKTKDNKK